MPPWIIFHGAGYISQGEADYYDALGIGWHFQANAYADAAYSRKWLRAFIATLKAKGLGNYDHLLFLDDLKAQRTRKFLKIAMEGKVFPFPIPAGVHKPVFEQTHAHTFVRFDRFVAAGRFACGSLREAPHVRFLQS